MIDLLVAGGGPAGLATAIHGARAGLEVVVVERRRGVVDKACGEGLMPHAVRQLHGLGVHAEGKAFSGITYVDGERCVTGRFRNGTGPGVREPPCMAALLDADRGRGVQIVHGEIDDVSQDVTSVRCGEFHARYLAAADGLHSPIRASLGLAGTSGGVAEVRHSPSSFVDAVERLCRGVLGTRRRGVRDTGGRRLRRRRDSHVPQGPDSTNTSMPSPR